jgi:hypothetical protein
MNYYVSYALYTDKQTFHGEFTDKHPFQWLKEQNEIGKNIDMHFELITWKKLNDEDLEAMRENEQDN